MNTEKYIVDLLQDEFIEYASPILVNNLPSIDGLLPVNRKVIWALYKNKITHDKPFIKMLRASAMAMPYYIFGDMPLAAAMKNMGNNTLNYKYLEPKGSFGNKQRKDGVGASPRYIETKLSLFSEDLLNNIQKNNVTFKRNFDNTEDEPIILPSIMPNILVNNSQSIAVGESSKIPSHNLIEVCDSFISYIKTEDIDKSIELLNGADFSIGGQILNDKETLRKIYKTGRGSFTLVGNYIYDEKENRISITEVPYETYLESIEDKLREKYEQGLFKEIVDIHDHSDKDGIRLDIYLKKNTSINAFISKLRKYTPYESKLSCNFTILDLDGKTPVLMSLERIIQTWIKHRKNCIVKECNYDINQKQSELNKLYGIKTISNKLDKAISIIRSSKNEKIAIEKLIKEFILNEEQAKYISTIRLVNINQEWIFNKIKNISDLESEVKSLKSFVSNEKAIDDLIIFQLEEVKKKYGQPRKTEILYESNIIEISESDLVEDYTTTIVFTKEQYIKKNRKYSTAQKVKEGDEVLNIQQCSNRGKVILLSNKGNAYLLNISDLEDKLPSQLGVFLPSLLDLQKDETILNMLVTNDYAGHCVVVFENGKIAKIPLTSYQTKNNRKMLANSLSLESNVVSIYQISGDADIELHDSFGKTKIINTNIINEKSKRDTIGVQAHKSTRNGFKIVSSNLVQSNS